MAAHITPISRAVTLREVAEAAGVSTAAVSQALNSTGTLSATTRERIQSTAHQLGYVPNQQAASLRRGSTRSIGFVLQADYDLDSEQRWGAYYQRILFTLVSVAAAEGYTVTIIPDSKPELILSSRIDVLYYTDALHDDALIAEAHRVGIPVITNDFPRDERDPVVISSGYAESTRAALDFLRSRGAERVGLLTEALGYPADEVAENNYRSWCAENSHDVLIARGDYGRTDLNAAIDELLDAGVDAIYSFYEEGANILHRIQERGLRVPHDIQLVAACTINCEENASHDITSIALQPQLGPQLVFEKIKELASGKEVESTVIELPWELTARGTTR